jgi:hypothetical protein
VQLDKDKNTKNWFAESTAALSSCSLAIYFIASRTYRRSPSASTESRKLEKDYPITAHATRQICVSAGFNLVDREADLEIGGHGG